MIELLAVVTFVKQFRHYLWGRKFLVRTDHASLTWLQNFKEPEGMLARWLTVLDTYDFTVEYRKGCLHGNADTMSRHPLRNRRCKCENCTDCHDLSSKGNTLPGTLAPESSVSIPFCPDECIDEGLELHALNPCHSSSQKGILMPEALSGKARTDDVQCSSIQSSDNSIHNSKQNEVDISTVLCSNWIDKWSQEQLEEMQSSDSDIKTLLQFKSVSCDKPSKSVVNEHSQNVRILWSLWETLTVKDNLLWRTGENGLRLVLPSTLRSEIFQQLHESRLAGHLGRDKTIASIKKRFYWPNYCSDIRRWVSSCEMCSRRKPGPGRGKSELKQDISYQPLDRIALDILGPLPITSNDNQYVLVISDYYTKFTEAFALKDHTALTVADTLVTQFICRYGVPTIIHSDQGPEFESRLFQHMCLLLGIQKTRTVPYNPRSDGLVERHNRTIQAMLAMYVNDNRDDWDDHLPFIMMAYRASCHESTKCSPNLLMFGREITLPVDVMLGKNPGQIEYLCPAEYVEWLKMSMAISFKQVSAQLKIAASRQKKAYSKGLKPRTFSEGELVWRWYPPTANQKLGLAWIGPYKVLKKVTTVTYKIVHQSSNKILVVHVDHLKQCHSQMLCVGDTSVSQNIEFVGETDTETANFLDCAACETLPDPVSNGQQYRTRSGRTVKPKQIFDPSDL